MKQFIFIISLLSISRVLSAQSDDLQLVSTWMQGIFDSHEQHVKDTANYFDIHLEIVPVWTVRKDAIWFYVEQAVAGSLDKPYRQRIYRLTEVEDGLFESKVYLLKDPLRFAQHPDLVEVLSPDSITEKEGCSVFFRKIDNRTFQGGTIGKNCPSDRKGASYATSEVLIRESLLESWDRGFDDKDEQVWGAELGGYQFVKKQ